MWKWVGWTARAIATALLVSFLSIWTTGYIVNSYMETLLRQLDLPLQTQPFALSGVWGKLWGAAPVPQETAKASESPAPSAQPSHEALPSPSTSQPDTADPGREASAGGSSAAGNAQPGAAEASDRPSSGDTSQPDESIDPNAVPVMGSGAGVLDLTDRQRETLQAVMSKLSGEQLEKLSGYLEGGLTEEELAEATDLLKPSLTDEEYRQVMEIFAPRVTQPDSPAAVSPDPLTGSEP
ncbi:hypothetical protein [Cohnella caldifontis]|uniref:hypothetical protein n=1 Tax=Cohnella caldifontis TaxID=3027471 RepID=UPI0023ED8BD6|nr:hypothetical protein [Cohnella sp. YIM B05605]